MAAFLTYPSTPDGWEEVTMIRNPETGELAILIASDGQVIPPAEVERPAEPPRRGPGRPPNPR